MSDIVVVGMNHKTAPVEVRERLAFPSRRLAALLSDLRGRTDLAECVMLSTCNRVEIYGASDNTETVMEEVYAFLSEHGGFHQTQLAPTLYTHRQPESIRHLFRVASGLDSMVLGESEITAQVKDAYDIAHQHGTTGKMLNALFQRALNTAKEVRTRTNVGRGAISVGSVAVELAKKIFGQLTTCRVLLVGAGAVGERVLVHLVGRGASHVTVASRTMDNAIRLAEQYRGRATSLDRFQDELSEANIVITATNAPQCLIQAEMVDCAMHARRHRPLFLIDLAVPRNIDAQVSRLENVYLYDVDDLQGVVAGHEREREQAVEQSTVIVQRKVQLFMEWLQYAQQTPVPHRDARECPSYTAS